ncbi:hypothetical protein LXA43DRAFT_115191 [Ganoderma leucocontextum]|nr:hypothetical protein LXA43DRAFT_115191 [Ganoderma leucocontextum]
MDLSAAHSSSYTLYVGGGRVRRLHPRPHLRPQLRRQALVAHLLLLKLRFQCGGTSWIGPTVCAAGLTCVTVSPPYFSQCQVST